MRSVILLLIVTLANACTGSRIEPELSIDWSAQHDLVSTEYGHFESASQVCPETIPGQQGGLCGFYQVPLNWHHPDTKKINVFMRHYPLPEPNVSRGQLWVIDGGPGASGATFYAPEFVNMIHAMGWDLFLPTHRGVGFSTALDCSLTYKTLDKASAKSCGATLKAEYGGDLNWFSSVGAAYDLDYLIAANNPDDMPVIMLGGSYGTYLTQRFIQLFESRLSAAVLISGTSLQPKFENLPEYENETFRSMLRLCDEQADCAQMFDISAQRSVEILLLEEGWKQCEVSRFDSGLAMSLLRGMSMDHKLRSYIPLTIKQFLRCNGQDVVALDTMIEEFKQRRQLRNEQLFQFNPVVTHHQIFTELLGPDDLLLEAYSWADNLLLPNTIEVYLELKNIWPSRILPIALPTEITTDLPILTLHGDMDMQASPRWYKELTSLLKGHHQHSVLFHTAGHGTPNYTLDKHGDNCSWLLVEAFMIDPRAPLDTSCVKGVIPLKYLSE